MLICVFWDYKAHEIYTRDAAAVSVEHSEEANLEMPKMALISEQMGSRRAQFLSAIDTLSQFPLSADGPTI